jgi:hypothetical protein
MEHVDDTSWKSTNLWFCASTGQSQRERSQAFLGETYVNNCKRVAQTVRRPTALPSWDPKVLDLEAIIEEGVNFDV